MKETTETEQARARCIHGGVWPCGQCLDNANHNMRARGLVSDADRDNLLKGMRVALPPTPRTREEINHLQEEWFADPRWDIEETEGFEAHRHELRQFRAHAEAFWTVAHELALVEALNVEARALIASRETRAKTLRDALAFMRHPLTKKGGV